MTELDNHYMALMSMYKEARKYPRKRAKAQELFKKIRELAESGKISDQALELAAYI